MAKEAREAEALHAQVRQRECMAVRSLPPPLPTPRRRLTKDTMQVLLRGIRLSRPRRPRHRRSLGHRACDHPPRGGGGRSGGSHRYRHSGPRSRGPGDPGGRRRVSPLRL